MFSIEEMSYFVGLARRNWMRRNEVIHGGRFTHPNRIVSSTEQAIEDFNTAMDRGGEPVLANSNLSPGGWKAPEVGWLKANWDAAIDESRGRTGLGVIIRDSNGVMTAARCVTKQGCLNPAVGEAKAVLAAFQFCRELGIQQVHFEGDAKGVVDAIRSEAVDRGWMGHVIEDIKQELRDFENTLISFVKRDGNRVAHVLARSAVKEGLNKTWLSMPPECITDVLMLVYVFMITLLII
jgi:ribonuclease HI